MNKRIKERLILKPHIKKCIIKMMLSVIILLIGMILVKENPELKETINEKVYNKSIHFTKTKQIYKKYFGNIFSIEKDLDNTQSVFSEKISYNNKEKTDIGVKLSVANNYLVPIIESGVIIYIGEKDNISCLTIEQVDGIEVTYSNININNYKLYDYIEKGEYLGEVINETLYLSFQKDGKYLDYKEYI